VSHEPRVGLAAFNNRRSTYTKEIIENILLNLAAHPLIQDPPIWDVDGEPVRITKFRNFDGIELQNTDGKGLTLSVFPYNYTRNQMEALTVNSTNASVVYRQYTLGNGGSPLSSKDQCMCFIGFKLHLFGYDVVNYVDPFVVSNQQTTYEINQAEGILQAWAELLRLILVDERMRKLPEYGNQNRFLLTNSFVNYVNFGSGAWTENENLVFHTATLVWETIHYPKRHISDPPLITFQGGYIGDIPDPDNPGNIIEVCYDLSTDRYFNCATNASLSPQALVDPRTGNYYSSLRTNVIQLVDMVRTTRREFVTLADKP
jgi:hypothetical protein